MKKAIYINPKSLKMYTSNGDELATVYGPITFKCDKNDKIYFVADVEERTSKNGVKYFEMTRKENKEG